jgi:GH25 family lysozyme M1 (1,4-beta-N-acetylmuramidase)
MAIDVEKLSSPSNMTACRLVAGLRMLNADYFAMVYSNPDIIIRYLQLQELSQYLLWIAHWGTQCPTVPLPWFAGQWDTWQFRVVPGKPFGTGLVNNRYPKIDLDVVQ